MIIYEDSPLVSCVKSYRYCDLLAFPDLTKALLFKSDGNKWETCFKKKPYSLEVIMIINIKISVLCLLSYSVIDAIIFLLVLFANSFISSLDLDQARKNVTPDLDPICLTS